MGSSAVGVLLLGVDDKKYVDGCYRTPMRTERSSINSLPNIELGYIFDYLHWKDKLNLLKAIPEVFRVIKSPLGWRSFRAGERRSADRQQEELACVHEFGCFFQHCTLWLGRPCRSSWECTCQFDALSMGSVFPVLQAVVDNCQVLKSLRLYHPSHVIPQSCDTQIFKQYQQAIERLLLYAAQRTHFRLELCGLQYSQDHIRPISLRFLDYHISNRQVLQMVRVLDITRISDTRLHSVTPLTCLYTMVCLCTLKVPIHCISMATIQCLVSQQLTHLYLLSDDSTADHDFQEHQHLMWDSLLLPRKSRFSVHYIFKQRTIQSSDLTVNPFVKSVCLDSVCNPLTQDFMMDLADLYGNSLQLLAITQSGWKPEVQLSDLAQFAAKCCCLTHFLSTVPLPASLLLSLAHSAPSLKQVLVVEQDVEGVAEVASELSQHLKWNWRPHVSPVTFHVDICELSFILDDFTLRGY
ncbi:uncharacterized protein LOC143283307 [Babylonia areolata]|uniref:uncharacterized protein LOC143283307 n=1 Tax=Babylonia areolata TaxID=304850 RepID=UPI003FD1EEE7